MARKLTDSEFAERTRAANRRRTARYQQRLAAAGKTALTVWIDTGLKAALATAAAANGATIADTATALLSAALSEPARPATQTPQEPVDTLPLFDAPGDGEAQRGPAVDRNSRIRALKREQPELSNYAIADQIGCSEPTVRRALKRLNEEATAD